jgi:hypothetical protein
MRARDTCVDMRNVIVVTGYLENMGIDTSFVRLRSIVPELLHKAFFGRMATCNLHVACKGYM